MGKVRGCPVFYVCDCSFVSGNRQLTYVPGISKHQHDVLTKAFNDAIFLALNALHPPDSIPLQQLEIIYNKYFPPEDRDIVTFIYNQIVGDNIHSGNPSFAHLLVDVNDSDHICETTKDYMARNGSIITVCESFWTKIGDQPARTCADLPDDIVSWQMTFPGDSLFHLLIGYVGEKAIDRESITNWQVLKEGYTGAAAAMWIRNYTPEVSRHSLVNYDWYALVSLNRNFRKPKWLWRSDIDLW
ncbi:hypothetical protein ACLMJK_003252 [Lecanora helva]